MSELFFAVTWVCLMALAYLGKVSEQRALRLKAALAAAGLELQEMRAFFDHVEEFSISRDAWRQELPLEWIQEGFLQITARSSDHAQIMRWSELASRFPKREGGDS